MYDKLAAKVNNIDTSGFVLKTKYETDKSGLKKKTSDANIKYLTLVKKTDYNSKIREIESKIPSISGFAKNSALAGVENKILDVTSLGKKNWSRRKNIRDLK